MGAYMKYGSHGKPSPEKLSGFVLSILEKRAKPSKKSVKADGKRDVASSILDAIKKGDSEMLSRALSTFNSFQGHGEDDDSQ